MGDSGREGRRQQEVRAAEQHRKAYEEHPETAEDLEEAELNAQELVADEGWERWW